MNKKRTAFLALLLSISIGCTTHLALATDPANSQDAASTAADSTEETVVQEPEDTSTLQLSIEDALEYMETGNSDLQLADKELEILEYQYQQARARKDAVNSIVDVDTEKAKRLNDLRAEWNLANAQQARETKLKDLKVQITDQYQNILALQQQAANYTTQIANLDQQIAQVQLEIELGLKIPATIYAYDAQRSTLEAQQKAVLGEIESSLISLKQDLGISFNRHIVLTSSLTPYAQFEDSDLNSKIAMAIKSNYDFVKYERDIEITEIEYSIDHRYNESTADEVQLSIEDKKGTLSTLAATLEAGIRSDYSALKALESTIEANKLTVEADQINIDIMEKSIEVGKASSLEIISLQNNLLNDQLTLQKNIISYMTQAANLRNDLNMQ